MNCTDHHRRRPARRRAAVGMILAGLLSMLLPQMAAHAAVNYAVGMRGTVLGFSEWYGSYSFPTIGVAFCLDHGLASPDTDFGYRRMSPSPFTGERGNRLAYLAYKYGRTTDPVTAVAVKLVVHTEQQAQYPFGRLDVRTLTASQIAFPGTGTDQRIIDRARAIHADLAHAYEDPYRLIVDLPARMPADGRLRVNVLLVDAGARPIPGMPVTLTMTNTTVSTVRLTTDAAGRATSPLTARDVHTRITATGRATAPAPFPVVYAPSTGNAQRILMAGSLAISGTDVTSSASVPQLPRELQVTVAKSGDAEAFFPVDGATFRLTANSPSGAALTPDIRVTGGRAVLPTVDTAGLTSVWLVEVTPPRGYLPAAPVSVPLSGTRTQPVTNVAEKAHLRLLKRDARTLEPVAGAEFLVERFVSPAPDAATVEIARVTSALEPVLLSDLLPGLYRVTETQAPPGYELPPDAAVSRLAAPGETVEVVMDDNPLTGTAFLKLATGTYDPARYSLAGAVFAVVDGSGTQRASCTTDVAGFCATGPHDLVVGATYCWQEVTAPAGFAAATPGCFTAGEGDGVLLVEEVGQFSTIEGLKVDAETQLPLAGAVLDLLGPAGYPLADGPVAPDDVVVPPGHVWLARATSGEDGRAVFPPVLPGQEYCLLEVTAPEGYTRRDTLACGTAGSALELTYANSRTVDEEVTAPSPTPSPSPTESPTPSPSPSDASTPSETPAPPSPSTAPPSPALSPPPTTPSPDQPSPPPPPSASPTPEQPVAPPFRQQVPQPSPSPSPPAPSPPAASSPPASPPSSPVPPSPLPPLPRPPYGGDVPELPRTASDLPLRSGAAALLGGFGILLLAGRKEQHWAEPLA